jgi:hypothetical protein
MPRAKSAFWNEFTLVATEENDATEKYSCNHCNIVYVKNASRMQKHIENCTNYQSTLEQTPGIEPNLQIPKNINVHLMDLYNLFQNQINCKWKDCLVVHFFLLDYQ